MNIVFAGTPEFAAIALQALLDARHHVPLVLTQPDRARGRGRRVQFSAVKRLAMERGLAVLQPPTLRDRAVHAAIQSAAPDAMVVAAYGLLIPRAILDLPRRGAINIHASLLPRWRGATPIQRALIAGDAVTGISIMQMDEGLDTGPIVLQEAIPMAPQDTARTLHDRLAALGARLIVDALAARREPQPQATSGVTYATKIERSEARIDWSENAALIERKVRAFDPEPGAHTTCDGEMLKLWRVRTQTGESGKPGVVLEAGAHGVLVACGTDALWLVEVQRPGGRRLPIEAFVAGHPVSRGAQLG